MSVDYMNNSVFIDESGFNANLRTQGWAPKGEAVKVLTARANSISILGTISAKGLIKISLRKPHAFFKEKKASRWQKAANKGHGN